MGGLSVWHWLMFLAVALLLFGGSGKISSIMGDVAKGIKSFKKGMAEDDETAKTDDPPRRTSRPRSIESAARPSRPSSRGRGAQQGRLERQEPEPRRVAVSIGQPSLRAGSGARAARSARLG